MLAVGEANFRFRDGGVQITVPVTVNVLANDNDVEGNSLSVTQASCDKGGAVINADNTITVTPITPSARTT